MFPVSHVPCVMIMRERKARGEGWGQYANSGCTFKCLTTSVEWFEEMGYYSPPSFPSLSPHISLHLCPPSSPAFTLIPLYALHYFLSQSLTVSPLLHHLPATPLLHPPTPPPSLSHNMRYICFCPPGCESGMHGRQSADVLVSG